MKPFLITWAGFVVFMMGLAVVFPGLRTRTDFPCFYAGGLLARTEPSALYDLAQQRTVEADAVGWGNGWTMFIQPPYEALLLEPFSLLPYRTAYLAYLALNLALLVPCFLMARDAFSNPIDPWQLQPGLMFFFFLPLWLALFQGQASVRLLLLCCAAWWALKRGRDFAAGFLLALGLFKLQVVIPLVFLLVVWRGLRMLAGFATGSVVVGAVSVWMVGLAGVREFLGLLLRSSLVAQQHAADASTGQIPSLMPNLRGLVYGCGGKYLPHGWLLGVTVALSAALLVWVVWLLRTRLDEEMKFAAAVLGATLLSYHFHTHDLTVVLLAVGLLAGKRLPRFDAVALVLFLLPVVVLFFFAREHFVLAVPLVMLLAMARHEPVAVSSAAQTA